MRLHVDDHGSIQQVIDPSSRAQARDAASALLQVSLYAGALAAVVVLICDVPGYLSFLAHLGYGLVLAGVGVWVAWMGIAGALRCGRLVRALVLDQAAVISEADARVLNVGVDSMASVDIDPPRDLPYPFAEARQRRD